MSILAWIVVAVVAFIVFRMVIGAIKATATIIFWLVIAAALGGGYLWYQNGMPGIENLPSVEKPSLSQ